MILCSGPAYADVAAWCGGETFNVSSYDLQKLAKETDPRQVMETLAEAACSTRPEVEAQRAELDKARAEWGAKYGMVEADWADVLAFHKGDSSFKANLSTKTIATFTPIDQYAAIREPFRNESGYEISDPLYVTDALESQLSETGRLAFLDYCVKEESVSSIDHDVVKWALCQPDIDKYDPKKVYAEVNADGAHGGAAKMWLRWHAAAMVKDLKNLADRKAALFKKDDEYKKVFDVAAKGPAEWARAIGTHSKLLELASAMDSAAFFHSRKLLEGCEARTAEALAEAVATLSAKTFAGMHDVRDDPTGGFANKAMPVLARTAVVHLAASAYAECQPKTPTGGYLAAAIQGAPGARGPRLYALGAVMAATFNFDDARKKGLDYPNIGARPYMRSGGEPGSAGGVVKSVKPGKDRLTVSLEKTIVKTEDCVQEHRTNRVTRIRYDGSLEYEAVCDKTALVAHDTTWADFSVNPKFHHFLNPGVVFSSIYGEEVTDVIAIWPNKGAQTPTWVLGATVK